MKTTTLFACLAMALLTASLSATPARAWLETKLTTSDAVANDDFDYDDFGYSVAISGNMALVGAAGNDNGGRESGSAYLFENIPEPSSFLLATLAGLFTLGATPRRRRK